MVKTKYNNKNKRPASTSSEHPQIDSEESMDVIGQPEVVDHRQSLVNDPKDQEEDDPHQQGQGPVDVDDSKNLDDEEENEVENRSEGS